MASYGVYPEPC